MKYVVILLCSFYLSQSFAQVSALAAWDFNGLTGAEAAVPATTLHAFLESSSTIRGAGLQPSSLTNAFQASQWTTTATLSDAILNDDYFAFTLQPKNGYLVSLEQLSCNVRRSSTGPDHFQWMYKINDGPLQTIGPEIIYAGTTTNGATQPLISLLPYAELQHVGRQTNIEFRLYGYNAAGSTGTFALGRLLGNDLELTGTVLSALPILLENVEVFRRGIYDVVQWTAIADDPLDLIYIERSLDGLLFQPFQAVALQLGTHAYQRMNIVGTNAPSYVYRLRMASLGMQDHYSAMFRVHGVPEHRVVLYPNPARSTITLAGLQIQHSMPVMLLNVHGQVLQRYEISAQQHSLRLDLKALQPGTYYLSVPGITSIPFLKE